MRYGRAEIKRVRPHASNTLEPVHSLPPPDHPPVSPEPSSVVRIPYRSMSNLSQNVSNRVDDAIANALVQNLIGAGHNNQQASQQPPAATTAMFHAPAGVVYGAQPQYVPPPVGAMMPSAAPAVAPWVQQSMHQLMPPVPPAQQPPRQYVPGMCKSSGLPPVQCNCPPGTWCHARRIGLPPRGLAVAAGAPAGANAQAAGQAPSQLDRVEQAITQLAAAAPNQGAAAPPPPPAAAQVPPPPPGFVPPAAPPPAAADAPPAWAAALTATVNESASKLDTLLGQAKDYTDKEVERGVDTAFGKATAYVDEQLGRAARYEKEERRKVHDAFARDLSRRHKDVEETLGKLRRTIADQGRELEALKQKSSTSWGHSAKQAEVSALHSELARLRRVVETHLGTTGARASTLAEAGRLPRPSSRVLTEADEEDVVPGPALPPLPDPATAAAVEAAETAVAAAEAEARAFEELLAAAGRAEADTAEAVEAVDPGAGVLEDDHPDRRTSDAPRAPSPPVVPTDPSAAALPQRANRRATKRSRAVSDGGDVTPPTGTAAAAAAARGRRRAPLTKG